MKIAITNRLKRARFNRTALAQLAAWLAHKAGLAGWEELSVVVAGHADLRRLKREFFNLDTTTDVVSFAYAPPPGAAGGERGEIIVNLEMARAEGRRRGGVAHEFALYLAHGLDHLAGQDDDTPARRIRMRRRELRWLKKAQQERRLRGLLPGAAALPRRA